MHLIISQQQLAIGCQFAYYSTAESGNLVKGEAESRVNYKSISLADKLRNRIPLRICPETSLKT